MKRIIPFATAVLCMLTFAIDCSAQRGGFGGGRGAPSGPRVAPEKLDAQDGVAELKDMEAFEKLSYQGTEVMIDTNLTDWQFVKFQLEDCHTEKRSSTSSTQSPIERTIDSWLSQISVAAKARCEACWYTGRC